ncbi:MAG: phage portal protein, partial [Oscillibacter sp.]
GVVPFKLQTLEVDELDTNQTRPKTPGNRVVGGIEYNEYRRAAGYWIRQYDIEGWRILDPIYIEAKDVYFFKTKHRPSQLREMSDMTPTITRIRDANEFITAVSVKERIAACLSVFIKKTLPTGGIGRGAVRTADGQVDYAGKRLGPGMIMEMNAGDDAQVVDPKGAATDATAFLKTQQGLIGAGQGLSYEAVSRDMTGATYSSARQNAIEDESTYAEDMELLTDFMSEVYENFIISGYLAGLFNLPGFWDKKADYMEHTWVKAPKKWIDPSREATADKTALQSGQKTFPDLCAERGKDWKEAVDEMAQVLEYGRKSGIEMGGVIFGNGTTAAQQNTGTEPGHQPEE